MTIPTIQTAFNAGELSPALYGRVDLEKWKRGCSTLRNFFASYRGGASTRAGTKFCGVTKQGNKGLALGFPPPRNITFQFNVAQGIVVEAGEQYFRFLSAGAYITETPTTITGISAGQPGVVTDPGHGYANGDEVYLTGIESPLGLYLNNRSYEVANVTTDTYTLVNVLDGSPIATSSLPVYTAFGTAARIYTLPTPYAALDLPYLKWSQSADVMSFTCVNTTTLTSYAPADLARIAADNWTLTKTTFTASIAAPASISLTASFSSSSTASFWYQFVMTAVDAKTGEESVASPVGSIECVDIAAEAATIQISGASVTGAGTYNFYVAPETYLTPPAGGAMFGYIGSAFGPVFDDTNVQADFAKSPPLHRNPFATSSLLAVNMTAGGASYSSTATTAAVTSPIGQNPVLMPVVVKGAIVWTSVTNGGAGMTGGEAVTFIDGTGMGHGATATLTIGPSTGTFPSVVSYFQQRRIYANTLNQPDTYFASQPGAFTNMDSSIPVVDSDAITGSPWSQEVNGIQWMLNMPGGLVIFTGLGAWQLSGAGQGLATSAALTPANQVANPQAYNGCSPLVPPIPINYDILYVQEKGSIVRDLAYNFFVNIYTGTDMTVLSNHLFDNFLIVQWAWSEEPNKLLWAIRNDGTALCLTFLKEQDVYAWSRHDTNGRYQSVCSVSEPPVNAPYFIVQRLIQNDGDPVWVYFQERMDDRLWDVQEDAWCVDAGLSTAPRQPNATLFITSSAGIPTLTAPDVVYGGTGYSSSTYARIADPTGSGAAPTLTIVGGVVTGAAVGGTLTCYTAPVFQVIDPTGAGGGAQVSISTVNGAAVGASANVFFASPGFGAPGDTIRMGGRTMVVTQLLNASELFVDIIRDDEPVVPDDPFNTPVPALAGEWSIAAPISTVYGLNHLEGMTVSILADGIVVAPQVVSGGTITLPTPASLVTAGLGFVAQLQTLYWDAPSQGGTVQGRRKEIDQVIARVSASGIPFSIGVNQPDAAAQPGQITVPWQNMTPVQGAPSGNDPLQPYDLVTADIWTNVADQLGLSGAQVAVQQDLPLPLTLLAAMPWVRVQDDVDV